MSKEIKIILFIAISMIINIIAPIMCINTVRDYTRTSEIVGSPSNEIVISEFVPVKNYVFQENLSKINFVADEETGYYLYSYYFSTKDFDSSKNNYEIFINDYALTITSLQNKAISGQYKMNFKDISGNILNTVTIDITFEFYSSYSYLFLKIDTTDITYFNGFRENPGFVLTLSAVDYGMNGIIIDSDEDVTDEVETSYTAKFIVNEELYAVKTVKESENYAITLPDNPDIENFAGWTVDGQTKVDFSSFIWTADTTFTALIGEYCEVKLIYDDGTEFATYSVLSYTTIADIKLLYTNKPKKTDHSFKGWSIDGETVLEDDYIVMADTTLIGVFKRYGSEL
ncbi:MAG: InlB B-repeat-containing protein [Clostridia bacterium]|nr:InlB B-repeat-containing protein [Clostridia bacterium]